MGLSLGTPRFEAGHTCFRALTWKVANGWEPVMNILTPRMIAGPENLLDIVIVIVTA